MLNKKKNLSSGLLFLNPMTDSFETKKKEEIKEKISPLQFKNNHQILHEINESSFTYTSSYKDWKKIEMCYIRFLNLIVQITSEEIDTLLENKTINSNKSKINTKTDNKNNNFFP